MVRKLALAVALLLLAANAGAWSTTGTELGSAGWSYWNYAPAVTSNNSSETPPSGSSSPVVEFKIPANMCTTTACSGDPGGWFYEHSGTNNIWLQFWFKYKSNYDLHSNGNKLIYFKNSANQAVFIIDGPSPGAEYLRPIVGAACGSYGGWLTPNLATTTLTLGNWYKVKFHMNLSTGLVEYWINDVKNGYYTNITPSCDTSITSTQVLPIWGGQGEIGPSVDDYIYFDDVYVSNDTDPGGSVATDTVPPYVYGTAPAEGSTGQPKATRTIVAHVADAGSIVTNVLRSSVSMQVSVNGGAYTTYAYGTGLTFSPNNAYSADFTVTRTMVSDWNDGDAVSVKIDATDVTGNVMPQKTYSFMVAQAGSATYKTRAQVLTYLQGLNALSSKKVLSGQFTQFLPWPLSGLTDFNATASVSGGKYPALMGADFGSLGYVADNTDLSDMTSMLTAHWNAGGLVTVSFHAMNPVDNSWSWSGPGPAVTLSDVYTVGNARYNNFHDELDRIATVLQTLENDNVVVLFRPFHEMNGNWFWWGAGNATQYKALWVHVHDYLTTTKGLSNLIWVYGVNYGNGATLTYYPGDPYVDLVGIDYYAASGRFSTPGEYSALVGTGKPFLVTEIGQCAPGTSSIADGGTGCPSGPMNAQYIIDDIEASMPAAVGFMVWGDPYSLALSTNVTSLFNSTYVINRADNPSGGLTAASVSITTTSVPNGTVGTAYNQSLSLVAVNGTSPYTWDKQSGTLPTGLSLSTAGVISGTPTTAGTYTFVARVTDSSASPATDNQSLSIVVAPLLPGGQTTTTGTITSFTKTNSGASSTNYYGTAEVYQWPSTTVANRVYLQDNTAKGLPDNISITSATLRGRVSSWEGSGGTVPMRVHAYNVTDNIPTLSTVTWANDTSTRTELSIADAPLSTGWVSWNVLTSAQTAKAGNATMTLALDGGPDGASDTNRIFDQFEIVITYTQLVAPGGPSISAPGKFRVSKAVFKKFH